MTRKPTTLLLPEEFAEAAAAIARARGVSVTQMILDAIDAELDRVRQDEEFMGRLDALIERDEEILDRLAERDT
jgi:hypothetical protein